MSKKSGIENLENSLIVYFVAGYPTPDAILKFMRCCRADVIELGIPFSDPVADGVAIQKAHAHALEKGFRVKESFEIIKKFRREDARGVVVMTYFNPVYRMGVRDFIEKVAESGGDGMLIVDLPCDSEEIGEYTDVCRENGMSPIMLAAPNTSTERLRLIDEVADVVYLISTYGVTGARERIAETAFEALERVKRIVRKPVIVGFGVSKREHVVSLLSAGADGVVVGSAVIDIIARNTDVEKAAREVERFTAWLKDSKADSVSDSA